MMTEFLNAHIAEERDFVLFREKARTDMSIYYAITLTANIIAAIVFRKSINITAISLLPLLLIALMCFQAIIFKNERSESGFDTSYGSDLTPNEKNHMSDIIFQSLLGTTVWMIPFVLFFSSAIKFISIGIYLIGFATGTIIYRIKNKSSIMSRMNKEDKERREQEKREELGKFK